MALQYAYRAQVDLLIRCLPAVTQVTEFALKGGTAINLFHQDMPRLSVDIDLTFLPISYRDSALEEIRSRLLTIAEEIHRTIPGVQIQLTEAVAPKLLVGTTEARVKIEPSVVMRGSLFPPVESDLCPAAQEAYELFVQVQRLHTADLYGGKLCAALDRQHPRDLLDIMHLQTTGEIPDETRQAFVAYLAGHHRPIAELLAPKRKPIEDLFAHHFLGITEQPIELDALEAARTRLFEWAATALTESERRFLLSIKQDEPNTPDPGDANDKAALNCEALYKLVWSEPMLKVAARFGVSSSYMARVCTLLNVPRPERGYWAKLAVGKAPKQPALPDLRPGDPLE